MKGRLHWAESGRAKARILVLGAAAPVYLMMFKQEREKRLELEKQLKSRTSARANIDSNYRSSSSRKNELPEEMTAAEAVERVMEL